MKRAPYQEREIMKLGVLLTLLLPVSGHLQKRMLLNRGISNKREFLLRNFKHILSLQSLGLSEKTILLRILSSYKM